MTIRTDTLLDDLVAGVHEDLATDKGRRSLAEMRSRAADNPPTLSFADAIRKPDLEKNPGEDLIRVIAEVKRASPSQGVIADRFEPYDIARRYEDGGASAISVLTERRKFRGSIDDLRAVRASVGLPILRKDFIFDPYQVYEARAGGADAILLIAAILEESALEDLRCLAEELSMAALVEIYAEEEVERSLASGSRIVGVNNRNLKNFEVDTGNTFQIHSIVTKNGPKDLIFVSESGIFGWKEVAPLVDLGVDAILVGESLMRAESPGDLLKELRGVSPQT